MNTKQPEALRLADALTIDGWQNVYHVDHQTLNDAAEELIRLHTANVELIEALRVSLKVIEKLSQKENKGSLLARVCCI